MSRLVSKLPIRMLAPVLAGMLAIGGCSEQAATGGTAMPPSEPAASGERPPTPGAGIATAPPSLSTAPTPADSESRVTYGWDVPTGLVTIPHVVPAPIAPNPELPLPSLVRISADDHPEAHPAYQRISFHFRGAFPSYNFGYVPTLTADPTDEPIPLEGNGVLRIRFFPAQAHDNIGGSTVVEAPQNPIAFQNLKSYGFAGDYEGYLTFGLGLQVAPDSDQVLAVRSGEYRAADAAGEATYVVSFDIMNG